MKNLSLLFTIHFFPTANSQPLITFNTKTYFTLRNNSPLSVSIRYPNSNGKPILA
jgi:hypothetical protein